MPVLTSLEPVRVVEGGRLWLRGDGFPSPESTTDVVTIGGVSARMSFAASDRLAVVVPTGLDGGETPVKVAWLPGATLYARVGTVLATGLHQVEHIIVGKFVMPSRADAFGMMGVEAMASGRPVIIAEGTRLQHFINGVQTVSVNDQTTGQRLSSGVLALDGGLRITTLNEAGRRILEVGELPGVGLALADLAARREPLAAFNPPTPQPPTDGAQPVIKPEASPRIPPMFPEGGPQPA